MKSSKIKALVSEDMLTLIICLVISSKKYSDHAVAMIQGDFQRHIIQYHPSLPSGTKWAVIRSIHIPLGPRGAPHTGRAVEKTPRIVLFLDER